MLYIVTVFADVVGCCFGLVMLYIYRYVSPRSYVRNANQMLAHTTHTTTLSCVEVSRQVVRRERRMEEVGGRYRS